MPVLRLILPVCRFPLKLYNITTYSLRWNPAPASRPAGVAPPGAVGPSCEAASHPLPAPRLSLRNHVPDRDPHRPANPRAGAPARGVETRVKDRLAVAVVALGAIIVFNVGREAYRWYAFKDERTAIVRLRKEVVDAGAELTFNREQLNVLRQRVEKADSSLNQDVEVLRRYSLQADGGMLPPPMYGRYVQDRQRYEQELGQRQQWFEEWERVQGRYHVCVDRYTTLADSIRNLATRIGDPYYHVPLPVEAAAERGLIKVDSGHPAR